MIRLVVGALAVFTGLLGAGPKAAAQPQAVAQVSPFKPLETWVAMRDGVKLAANVYLPAGSGPWPVVVTRTPYLKDGPFYANPLTAAGVDGPSIYTSHDYVLVVEDVRGRGRSQGHYSPFGDDIADGYDTIEWAAGQSWSNGKVGITGASAMGITANLAAIGAPPHLLAAFSVVSPLDRFESSTFTGGVLRQADMDRWLKSVGLDVDKTLNSPGFRPTADVFSDRTEMSQGLKYVRIPMYHVGGWYDAFDEGTVEKFVWLQNHGAQGARGRQKLLMTPSGHGPLAGDLAYPGADRTEIAGAEELRWFDHWLKGADNGIMDEPPVNYFMMAAARKGAYSTQNRFIHAANWPPASREVRYYAAPGGKLSSEAPTATDVKVSYRFDPALPVPTLGGSTIWADLGIGPANQSKIPPRQDYLRFKTEPLTRDVAIAGQVTVDLYAATDGPDTDFMAKLVDVYPDGYEALVLDAPIRARYRRGRDPDQVRMMMPGVPAQMTIDLWETALTFEKGHRIELVITSSNSPRFEINPNTGAAPENHSGKTRAAVNTIYFDQDRPTALVLPVVYPGTP